MVTFNFSNVSGNPGGQRVFTMMPMTTTTTTPSGATNPNFSSPTVTKTFGDNPITLTSNLTGAGLPGDSMRFIVTATSDYYSMNFVDSQDRLNLEISNGIIASMATFTIRFDAGSGLTRLSNVTINGGGAITSFASMLTENGAVGFTSGTFSGEITGIRFSVTGGQVITSIGGTPTCFAKGTRIAVPVGDIEVEKLSIGDTVLTHDGATREVLWVGRQRFDLISGVPERLQLVRVKAGALGWDLPKRDLVVTADHALLTDGVLVDAGTLVDGDRIDYEPVEALPKSVTVYHVETEDHAVILAEGAPAETFVDARQRAQFDNYDEYLDLYGADRVIPASPIPRASAKRLAPPQPALTA